MHAINIIINTPLGVFFNELSFLNVDITNLIPAVHICNTWLQKKLKFKWSLGGAKQNFHFYMHSSFLFVIQFFFSLIDAQSDSGLDCCLKVSPQIIPKHYVLSYINQVRGNGCPRDAVV